MADSPRETVSCKCGRVTAVQSGGLKFSKLRCSFCPPEKPQLRLVKP